MENFRFLRLLLSLLVFLSVPVFSIAYSDETTHPALTQEIVKFYNQSFPDKKISAENGELIIKGSIDEDKDTRWLQHFYDPVYDRGLLLENDAFPNNSELALIASGARAPFLSSKTWALSSKAQTGIIRSLTAGITKSYYGSENDYSWERAIYEYAWGDKNRGMESLGHILHLIEDASVPDHTRNDPHPPVLDMGSPYEGWTKKFDRNSIQIGNIAQAPIILSDIGGYFDSLANYSNNNFFSKDSIFKDIYKKPVVSFYQSEKLSNGISWTFGYKNERGVNYRLLRADQEFDWHKSLKDKEQKYFITDDDNLILSDYWSLLSKQAVLHGAGVIKLFFDEAEKEKQSKILFDKNRSWYARQMDKFRNGVFNIASVLYGSSVKLSDLEDLEESNAQPSPPPVTPPLSSPAQSAQPAPEEENPPQPRVLSAVVQTPAKPPSLVSTLPSPAPSPVQPRPSRQSSSDTSFGVPVAGGGGPAPQEDSTQSSSADSASAASFSPQSASETATSTASTTASVSTSSSATSTATSTPADSTPPASPLIVSPSSGTIATGTTITFQGTAESGAIVSNNFSSTTAAADASGNWSLVLNALSQGTSTIQFFAADAAGNISTSSALVIFVDSNGPSASFSITECGQSLSSQGCLLATTTISLAWSSSDPDFDRYVVQCSVGGAACEGFSFASTTATSTIYVIPAWNQIYTFTAKAYDRLQNEGALQTQIVEAATRPVVINEIGWMGTSANHSQDEWIELKNTTSRDINLSGWILRSKTDNSPYVALSGIIPAQGYFILERTDDTTISDISANQIYTGALSNSGEALELSQASTTMDSTPEINTCNGWCAGSTGNYYSMERYQPLDSGSTSSNWSGWLGYAQNGRNAGGNPINGTPGARNRANYSISLTGSLTQNKTLSASTSPYIVTGEFSIPSGVTLTVDPGTVIKIGGGLVVNGTVRAEGTSAEPIIITSIADDSYAGDTNGDGSASSPQAGSWQGIKILAGESIFDHTVIRYGGYPNQFYDKYWANIKAENSSLTLKNSIIEYSGVYGIWLKNATSTIEGNTIRYNNSTTTSEATGLFMNYGGNAAVRGNTFRENKVALIADAQIGSTTIEITNNNFLQNEYAIQTMRAYPIFSGNTAEGNGINGIEFRGGISRDYTLTADLPYLILGDFGVATNKTLIIDKGAIMKFGGGGDFEVYGTLLVNGSADRKVIFTSIYDDTYGGDTYTYSTSSPSAGDWPGFKFYSATASSSRISHAIIRYGGYADIFATIRGAVIVDRSSLAIENSVIEKSYAAGLNLKYATSTSISDSVVQDNRDPSSDSKGIFLSNSSSLSIQNVLFRNNAVAISSDGTASVQNGGGIIFEGNTVDDIPSYLIP